MKKSDGILPLAVYIAKQVAAFVYVFCAILVAMYVFNLMSGGLEELHAQLRDIVVVAAILLVSGSFLILRIYAQLQKAIKVVALDQENINALLSRRELRSGVEVSDDLFVAALKIAKEHGSITIAQLQKKFDIGYARASRLVDLLEDRGVIEKRLDTKPRKYLLKD